MRGCEFIITKTGREAGKFLSLFSLAVFACTLLVYRGIVLGGAMFTFLLWNLFLAWIPYGVSGVMLLINNSAKFKPRLLFIFPLGALWLIFFPNAPYILTCYAHFSWMGFFHESGFTLRPWYDFILFSSFILCGVLAGLASLRTIHGIIEKYFGEAVGWGVVIIVNFLSGCAIYLGRFIRLNSWDIKNPGVLLPHIRLDNEKALFIIALSMFFMMVYVVIYNFGGKSIEGAGDGDE